MKHKAAELEGARLDVAVALALGLKTTGTCRGLPVFSPPSFVDGPSEDQIFGDSFQPSTRWDHGGPIIERERIEHGFMGDGHGWQAAVNPLGSSDWMVAWVDGPTPLIAAMRAYVASKFGDEVELP